MLHCSYCEQEQPHVLYHNVQEDSLYAVKVKDTLLQRISVCDICGNLAHSTRPTVIATTSFWTIDTSMSKLAEETEYVIKDPTIEPVNTKTISKMLENIVHSKMRQDTTIKIKDIFFAVSLAALCYGIFKIIMRSQDEENLFYLIIGILLGFFVGLIGSVIHRYRKLAAIVRKQVLILQLEKLRLRIDDVKRLLDAKSSEDPKIKALLVQVVSEEMPSQ